MMKKHYVFLFFLLLVVFIVVSTPYGYGDDTGSPSSDTSSTWTKNDIETINDLTALLNDEENLNDLLQHCDAACYDALLARNDFYNFFNQLSTDKIQLLSLDKVPFDKLDFNKIEADDTLNTLMQRLQDESPKTFNVIKWDSISSSHKAKIMKTIFGFQGVTFQENNEIKLEYDATGDQFVLDPGNGKAPLTIPKNLALDAYRLEQNNVGALVLKAMKPKENGKITTLTLGTCASTIKACFHMKEDGLYYGDVKIAIDDGHSHVLDVYDDPQNPIVSIDGKDIAFEKDGMREIRLSLTTPLGDILLGITKKSGDLISINKFQEIAQGSAIDVSNGLDIKGSLINSAEGTFSVKIKKNNGKLYELNTISLSQNQDNAFSLRFVSLSPENIQKGYKESDSFIFTNLKVDDFTDGKKSFSFHGSGRIALLQTNDGKHKYSFFNPNIHENKQPLAVVDKDSGMQGLVDNKHGILRFSLSVDEKTYDLQAVQASVAFSDEKTKAMTQGQFDKLTSDHSRDITLHFNKNNDGYTLKAIDYEGFVNLQGMLNNKPRSLVLQDVVDNDGVIQTILQDGTLCFSQDCNEKTTVKLQTVNGQQRFVFTPAFLGKAIVEQGGRKLIGERKLKGGPITNPSNEKAIVETTWKEIATAGTKKFNPTGTLQSGLQQAFKGRLKERYPYCVLMTADGQKLTFQRNQKISGNFYDEKTIKLKAEDGKKYVYKEGKLYDQNDHEIEVEEFFLKGYQPDRDLTDFVYSETVDKNNNPVQKKITIGKTVTDEITNPYYNEEVDRKKQWEKTSNARTTELLSKKTGDKVTINGYEYTVQWKVQDANGEWRTLTPGESLPTGAKMFYVYSSKKYGKDYYYDSGYVVDETGKRKYQKDVVGDRYVAENNNKKLTKREGQKSINADAMKAYSSLLASSLSLSPEKMESLVGTPQKTTNKKQNYALSGLDINKVKKKTGTEKHGEYVYDVYEIDGKKVRAYTAKDGKVYYYDEDANRYIVKDGKLQPTGEKSAVLKPSSANAKSTSSQKNQQSEQKNQKQMPKKDTPNISDILKRKKEIEDHLTEIYYDLKEGRVLDKNEIIQRRQQLIDELEKINEHLQQNPISLLERYNELQKKIDEIKDYNKYYTGNLPFSPFEINSPDITAKNLPASQHIDTIYLEDYEKELNELKEIVNEFNNKIISFNEPKTIVLPKEDQEKTSIREVTFDPEENVINIDIAKRSDEEFKVVYNDGKILFKKDDNVLYDPINKIWVGGNPEKTYWRTSNDYEKFKKYLQEFFDKNKEKIVFKEPKTPKEKQQKINEYFNGQYYKTNGFSSIQ